MNSDPFDIGITTRNGLKCIKEKNQELNVETKE